MVCLRITLIRHIFTEVIDFIKNKHYWNSPNFYCHHKKKSSVMKTVWNFKLDWTWKMKSKILPDIIWILLWHVKLGWGFDTSGAYGENRSKLQMCEKTLLCSFARIFFPNLSLALYDLQQHKSLQNIVCFIFPKCRNYVLH